jgi:probable HAF family extracellular repeat protein
LADLGKGFGDAPEVVAETIRFAAEVGLVGCTIEDATDNEDDVAPFLWDRGAMTNLGNLGGTFGYGECANNRGQVIGQSNLAGDSEQHAFLWESGVMKDLGTLGGTFSLANWLSTSLVVVGGATTVDEFFHATMFNGGRITDLGVLPGYDCSNANALNSKGQIVGQAFDCTTHIQHATLWEDGGSAVDLNALIPPNSSLQLVGAININEQGEILGVGVPRGSLPTDHSADLIGRLFLLIPCGLEDREEHDCDSSLQSGINTQPNASLAKMGSSGAKGLTSDALAALRARLTHSQRAPANGTVITPRH